MYFAQLMERHFINWLLLLTSVSLALCTFAHSQNIPAFPGAEGFGSMTKGGRGGKVIKVANLNDHGPGSFRDALLEKEPRIILFDVSGIIDLETTLLIENPFVTIAGQTAPGDGICVRGAGISVKTHDVVLRYLRIRPGDIDFGEVNNWGVLDGLGIANYESPDSVNNVIVDHTSISWAVDENVGIWYSSHDITIQNCIISEALHDSQHPKGPHSMGMLIGAESNNISIHHNLFMSNNNRNPLVISSKILMDFRNNIIYNPGGQISSIQSKPNIEYQKINYVNNLIIKGQNTTEWHEITLKSFPLGNYTQDNFDLYIHGNKTENSLSKTDDNRQMIDFSSSGLDVLIQNISQQEFEVPLITTNKASDLPKVILSHVGSTLPNRDQADKKLLNDLEFNRGKIINKRRSIFNWPHYTSLPPKVDSDNDGMPDEWEKYYHLNNNSDESSLDMDDDGYTNIEEYINGTPPDSPKNKVTTDFLSSIQSKNVVSSGLKILQAFPNPTSDTIFLNIHLPENGNVKIKIVDNIGRSEDLYDQFMYAGNFTIDFDISTFNQGTFHVCVYQNNNFDCSKIIKIN